MNSAHWLDDDEQAAWRAFLHAHRVISSDLASHLQRESDLSYADYEVLVHLTDVDGQTLRIHELRERLRWEQSRLSHQLTRMQGRGLVSRRDCAEDKRGLYIEITPQGLEAIRAAAPHHVNRVRRLFVDSLSRHDLLTLGRMCEQLAEQAGSIAAEDDSST